MKTYLSDSHKMAGMQAINSERELNLGEREEYGRRAQKYICLNANENVYFFFCARWTQLIY